MLTVPTPPFRKRQRRAVAPAAAAPPPVLVGGTFQAEDEPQLLTLTFAQPITIGPAFDPAVLLVDDPRSGGSYRGTGAATFLDSRTIQVAVTFAGGSSGIQTVLNAGPSSGIVAAGAGAGDGWAWAGVSGFVLSTP